MPNGIPEFIIKNSFSGMLSDEVLKKSESNKFCVIVWVIVGDSMIVLVIWFLLGGIFEE